ncbi:MAG: hypothetical protein ACLFRI_05145 [Candidatus Izemoplasmataceae bacterium]
MSIRSFLETNVETKERKLDSRLQTHYFRHSYKSVKETYLKYLTDHGYQVKTINDVHHEVFAEHKNHFVIATITQINPAETALDLKVGYETLFGFNRPKNTILSIYAEMKKTLTFKGTGLHA